MTPTLLAEALMEVMPGPLQRNTTGWLREAVAVETSAALFALPANRRAAIALELSNARRIGIDHYDWFMPKKPTAEVDAYLDDFEAKMREALTDPFISAVALTVLSLIAVYRAVSAERDRLRRALLQVEDIAIATVKGS